MTIKTKYNLGDDVWCNIYNGIKVKITAIHVIIVADDNYTIEYSVSTNGIVYGKMENELFSTKEELLKNL